MMCGEARTGAGVTRTLRWAGKITGYMALFTDVVGVKMKDVQY